MKARERILQSALELIRKEGFETLTVRKIAKEAKVNVAMINYYFGSKDKLVNTVIHLILNQLTESFAILDDETIDAEERLKRFLYNYITIFQKYPTVIRRLLQNDEIVFESQREHRQFIKAFGFKKLHKTIQEITGETDEKRLTIILNQVLGAIFFPILLSPITKDTTGQDVPDVKQQIDVLFEHYFCKNLSTNGANDRKTDGT